MNKIIIIIILHSGYPERKKIILYSIRRVKGEPLSHELNPRTLLGRPRRAGNASAQGKTYAWNMQSVRRYYCIRINPSVRRDYCILFLGLSLKP